MQGLRAPHQLRGIKEEMYWQSVWDDWKSGAMLNRQLRGIPLIQDQIMEARAKQDAPGPFDFTEFNGLPSDEVPRSRVKSSAVQHSLFIVHLQVRGPAIQFIGIGPQIVETTLPVWKSHSQEGHLRIPHEDERSLMPRDVTVIPDPHLTSIQNFEQLTLASVSTKLKAIKDEINEICETENEASN